MNTSWSCWATVSSHVSHRRTLTFQDHLQEMIVQLKMLCGANSLVPQSPLKEIYLIRESLHGKSYSIPKLFITRSLKLLAQGTDRKWIFLTWCSPGKMTRDSSLASFRQNSMSSLMSSRSERLSFTCKNKLW
jgi:hypothetical protein